MEKTRVRRTGRILFVAALLFLTALFFLFPRNINAEEIDGRYDITVTPQRKTQADFTYMHITIEATDGTTILDQDLNIDTSSETNKWKSVALTVDLPKAPAKIRLTSMYAIDKNNKEKGYEELEYVTAFRSGLNQKATAVSHNYPGETVEFCSYSVAYKSEKGRLAYLDEKGKTQYREEGQWSNFRGEAGNGWYAVRDDYTSPFLSITEGDCNLVLAEGVRMNIIGSGIYIAPGCSLTIWEQVEGSGKIQAVVNPIQGSTAAGIDVGSSADQRARLTINGCEIAVAGGDECAGIGSSKGRSYGDITINRGTVMVIGGKHGAGIGGGNMEGVKAPRTPGKITINGGTVRAEGTGGAGIGGGHAGVSGEIEINGGIVEAMGHMGAGIGGGHGMALSSYEGNSGAITIAGGTVTAKGFGGAGIGGGNWGTNRGKIQIYGPDTNVTAYTVLDQYQKNSWSAAIGAGNDFDQGEPIIISGGANVMAVAAREGAGIGGGCGSNGGKNGGVIEIRGKNTSVIAVSGTGAGIGSGGPALDQGKMASLSYGGTITIDDGFVYARSYNAGAGIGGGNRGNSGRITINGGYVIAIGAERDFNWARENKKDPLGKISGKNPINGWMDGYTYDKLADAALTVIFSDEFVGAGIGGGFKGSCRKSDNCFVHINGGYVQAKAGSKEASAIGYGRKGKTDDLDVAVYDTAHVTIGEVDKNKDKDGECVNYLGSAPSNAKEQSLAKNSYGLIEPGLKLTFNMKGHGQAPDDISCGFQTSIDQPDDPEAEGWKFTGWYEDEACKEAFSFDWGIEEDTTVYAGWQPENPDRPLGLTVEVKWENTEIKPDQVKAVLETRKTGGSWFTEQSLILNEKNNWKGAFHIVTGADELRVRELSGDDLLVCDGDEETGRVRWLKNEASFVSLEEGKAKEYHYQVGYETDEKGGTIITNTRDGRIYSVEKTWMFSASGKEGSGNIYATEAVLQHLENGTWKTVDTVELRKDASWAAKFKAAPIDKDENFRVREQIRNNRQTLYNAHFVPDPDNDAVKPDGKQSRIVYAAEDAESGGAEPMILFRNIYYAGTLGNEHLVDRIDRFAVHYGTLRAGAFSITNSQVDKKNIKASAEDVTVKYDGKPHGIQVKVTDPTKGAEVRYGLLPNDCFMTESPTITDVEEGPLPVFYEVTADGYEDYQGLAYVEILGMDPTIQKKPAGKELTYNGKGQTLAEPGSVYSGGHFEYAIGTDALIAPEEGWSENIPTGTTAGTYYVWYKVAGDDNYTDTEPACVETVIKKAPLTITAKDNVITYGDAPTAKGVTYDGFVTREDGTEEGASVLKGELGYEFSYSRYGDVGDSYVIRPVSKGLQADNYEIRLRNGILKVLPKEVGLAWTDTELTYNGKPQGPKAAATGLVNGDVVEVTVTGEKTNPGDYTAEATGLTGEKAKNYKLPEDRSADFTIGKAELTSVRLERTILHYTGEELTAKIAEVKAGDLTVPAGAYTVTGNRATETGKHTVRVTAKEDSAFTGSAEAEYHIVQSGLNMYEVVLKESELTYTGKPIGPEVWVFDVATGDLLERDEDYTLEYLDNVDASEPGASAKVKVTGLNGYKDYQGNVTVIHSFTIQKAPLTITAKDQTIPYDGTPVYSETPAEAKLSGRVTFDGFVDGEDEATKGVFGEDEMLTYAYTDWKGAPYQPGDLPDEYTIRPGGLTSKNYDITFVPGTLNVIPKKITIRVEDQSSVYGEEIPDIPYQIEDYDDDDDLGIIVWTEASTEKLAGEYPIYVWWDEDLRYDATIVTGTYTIKPVYHVQHYIQTVEDEEEFVLEEEETLVGSKTGDLVEAEPKTYAGIRFDENNANNVKRGVLTADGSLVLKLYYVRDTEIPYQVEYWLENAEGSEPSYRLADTLHLKGITGEEVAAEIRDYPGYVWDPEAEGTLQTGKIAGDGSLVLKLFYGGSADFRVEHYLQDLPDPDAPDKPATYTLRQTENRNGLPGTEVTATPRIYAGFTFDPDNENNIMTGTIVRDGSLTLKLYYTRNADTSYQVEHYLQNSMLDGYDLAAADAYAGMTGETVTAVEADDFAGFAFDPKNENNVVTGTITGDGSLTLKLYYNRGLYPVSYRYEGAVPEGAPAVPETAEYHYEDVVETAEAPSLAGYDFSGWSTVATFLMPAEAVEITGSWTPRNDTVYQIEHYLENEAMDGYDLALTESRTGTTGAQAEAEPKVYPGFVFDEGNVNNVTTGTIAGDGSLTLKLYYGRSALYRVEHYLQDLDDPTVFHRDEQSGGVKVGTINAEVTAEPETYEGYTFDPSVEGTVQSGRVSADDSLTLKLYYTRTRYAVTYRYINDPVPEGAPAVPETVQYPYEAWVEIAAEPTLEGYDFSGWSRTEAFSMPAEAVEITGSWTAKGDTLYRVEHYLQNLGDPTAYTRQDQDTEERTGQTGTTAAANPKHYDGFTFDAGNVNNVMTGTIAEDGSLTLKLYYNRNTDTTYRTEYYLQDLPDPNAPDVVPGFTLEKTVKQTGITGETVTAKVEREDLVGFTFDAGNVNNVTTGTVAGDGSLTLKLYYVRNTDTPYLVEHYLENPDGSYTLADAERFTYITGASVTAVERDDFAGYYFDGTVPVTVQTGTVAGDGSLVLSLYYKIATEAGYRIRHYLQTPALDGYELEVELEETGLTGTEVTAEPVPYTGFTFDPDVDGTVQTGTVAADGSLVLKLYYNRNQYTITYDPNGGTFLDGSMDIRTERHSFGETITIIGAPEREGYRFLYWKGSEYQPGDSYVVEGDHTFVAQWEKIVPPDDTDPDGPDPGKTPPDKTPPTKTGDVNSVGMWILLLMLSAAGGTAAVIGLRRKDNKN